MTERGKRIIHGADSQDSIIKNTQPTYTSTGVIVNQFNEAAQHSGRRFADALDFAHENRTCGYMVKFDKDGPLNIMAASVPIHLVREAQKLEGQRVTCTWIIESHRFSRVVSLRPAPVEAVSPMANNYGG